MVFVHIDSELLGHKKRGFAPKLGKKQIPKNGKTENLSMVVQLLGCNKVRSCGLLEPHRAILDVRTLS